MRSLRVAKDRGVVTGTVVSSFLVLPSIRSSALETEVLDGLRYFRRASAEVNMRIAGQEGH